MFNRHKNKRREQIIAYRREHKEQMILLHEAARIALQAGDDDHAKQLRGRASSQGDMVVHYERMLLEFDTGLDVELPGEGGW